jgi:hypothetical protein
MKKRKLSVDPEAIAEMQELDILDKQDVQIPLAIGNQALEEAMVADQQLNQDMALADVAEDVAQFQDVDYGTGAKLLPNDVIDAISRNFGDVHETEGLKSFVVNTLRDLDPSFNQEIMQNQDLADKMRLGISAPSVDQAKLGSKAGSPIDALKTPEGLAEIAPLLKAMSQKDLTADAMHADILAGIRERFQGRTPSMSLTRTGAFQGSTPAVGRQLLAEKIRARQAAAKIEAQKRMALQRAAIMREGIKSRESIAAMKMLTDREKSEFKKSKNQAKTLGRFIGDLNKLQNEFVQRDKERGTTTVTDRKRFNMIQEKKRALQLEQAKLVDPTGELYNKIKKIDAEYEIPTSSPLDIYMQQAMEGIEEGE